MRQCYTLLTRVRQCFIATFTTFTSDIYQATWADILTDADVIAEQRNML